MKGLDAGKDIVRTRETPAHGLGHGHFLESLVECGGVGVDEVLGLAGSEDVDVERGSLLAEESRHHATEGRGELLAYFSLVLFVERYVAVIVL